jgi:signal transduction histidine kinase
MHFARDAGLASTLDVVGKDDFDLSWRAQAELYRADDFAVMESGVARLAYEEPQTWRDGSQLWLRTSKIPLRDDADRIVGVLGVYEDITERKRAEQEQLRLQQQMQQAQKLESLGVLAGGIAHDFNNLLTAVLGNLELVRRRLPSQGAAADLLGAAETASRRAADLCRQMLAYSGRGRFVVQPIDLNTLVQEMNALLKVSISKRARLTLALDPDLPKVDGDAAQLGQVLMNLMTNASEAMGEGDGDIRLSTRYRQVTAGQLHDDHTHATLPPGTYVVLEVEDTGAGMDDTTRRRIFEPFFTTKFTGRGLGLAAVLGIVRGHHGAIKVRSSPSRGTTFAVFLPASTSVPEQPADRSGPIPLGVPSQPRCGRVLLADDEPMVREVGEALLQHLGYDVVAVADGREALAVYQPGAFSCVILDVTMPVLGGEPTLRELRRRDPSAKVVLASAYDGGDILARLEGLRPTGFLSKPFSLPTLNRALREILPP